MPLIKRTEHNRTHTPAALRRKAEKLPGEVATQWFSFFSRDSTATWSEVRGGNFRFQIGKRLHNSTSTRHALTCPAMYAAVGVPTSGMGHGPCSWMHASAAALEEPAAPPR